tara:strand:- start:7368 stop:8531 length:1164 start_codon:yes stop_codon:yes gene_type:complete
MATFQAQVEGLTGLSIGTSPTTGELSTFLADGAKDLINKLVKLDPASSQVFSTITSESGSGTIIDGKILDVWGSDGTNDHPATRVSASKGKRAADTSSLNYRSKYNPCYYREGKRVVVKPDGGSVLHISYPVVSYDQETIYNFPSQYLHMPVLYAGIKSLQNSLSSVDISTFSSTAVPPTTPSLPNITSPGVNLSVIGDFGTAPVYTQPKVGGIDEELTAAITTSATNPTIDFSAWFELAGDLIETEEDTELAGAQIQKISTYIQAYGQSMQNALNKFNDANAEYQATIQKKIQQAQIDQQRAVKEADLSVQTSIQDYTLELQRYSSELQKYQADTGKDVQTYQQEIAEKSAEYQWKVGRLQDLKQEYNQFFGMMAPPAQPQQQARG